MKIYAKIVLAGAIAMRYPNVHVIPNRQRSIVEPLSQPKILMLRLTALFFTDNTAFKAANRKIRLAYKMRI